ncbi:uncharacterized protein LOC124504842 [Lynx rufus]|uniref:uncharacterized protein LOC124504842 n=1 Tax=Lynx rufus TaxID=61384 RepID=UPI001F125161|nr:uncharacterized protein LOC124504842 [Lynx rufus]
MTPCAEAAVFAVGGGKDKKKSLLQRGLRTYDKRGDHRTSRAEKNEQSHPTGELSKAQEPIKTSKLQWWLEPSGGGTGLSINWPLRSGRRRFLSESVQDEETQLRGAGWMGRKDVEEAGGTIASHTCPGASTPLTSRAPMREGVVPRVAGGAHEQLWWPCACGMAAGGSGSPPPPPLPGLPACASSQAERGEGETARMVSTCPHQGTMPLL